MVATQRRPPLAMSNSAAACPQACRCGRGAVVILLRVAVPSLSFSETLCRAKGYHRGVAGAIKDPNNGLNCRFGPCFVLAVAIRRRHRFRSVA
jgi:hypothetical protein